MLLGREYSELWPVLEARYGLGSRVPVTTLCACPEAPISRFGRIVREALYDGYTSKHWGEYAPHLKDTVLARVPVIIGDQEMYFSEDFVAHPVGGYSALVTQMLDHPRIRVELGRQFARSGNGAGVVFTGALDEYFDLLLGSLPLRSLRFEHMWVETSALQQPVDVINYPARRLYKSHGPRHATGQHDVKASVIIRKPGASNRVEISRYIPCTRWKVSWCGRNT